MSHTDVILASVAATVTFVVTAALVGLYRDNHPRNT